MKEFEKLARIEPKNHLMDHWTDLRIIQTLVGGLFRWK